MKTIEIEDDLYQYIASQTQDIGESASNILRRLLIEKQQEQLSQAPVVLAPLESEQINVSPNDDPAEAKPSAAATKDLKVENVVKQSAVSKKSDYIGNVFNVLNKEEVVTQKGAVGRFLFILAAFHRCHASHFDKVLDIKGRERHYFGTSAEFLEASGSSIKPKQIPDSEFWVVTNNNTPRKKLIITEVATAFGYSQQEAEELRELI